MGAHFSKASAEKEAVAQQKILETTRSDPRTTTITLPQKTNNAWELPPFELKGLDGKLHQLAEWKGKVIMLNFWASWCAPCQYEIPDFVRFQERYADKGLQVVGLGLDEERKLRNVARTLGINYPVLVADLNDQANHALLPQWGNPEQIVPYTVVIAPSGRMVYIHRGRMGEEEFNLYVKP
ncbi:MAG: TlpA family protein disulfide reductase, partial [Gammaproteobacteria bacterium]